MVEGEDNIDENNQETPNTGVPENANASEAVPSVEGGTRSDVSEVVSRNEMSADNVSENEAPMHPPATEQRETVDTDGQSEGAEGDQAAPENTTPSPSGGRLARLYRFVTTPFRLVTQNGLVRRSGGGVAGTVMNLGTGVWANASYHLGKWSSGNSLINASYNSLSTGSYTVPALATGGGVALTAAVNASARSGNHLKADREFREEYGDQADSVRKEITASYDSDFTVLSRGQGDGARAGINEEHAVARLGQKHFSTEDMEMSQCTSDGWKMAAATRIKKMVEAAAAGNLDDFNFDQEDLDILKNFAQVGPVPHGQPREYDPQRGGRVAEAIGRALHKRNLNSNRNQMYAATAAGGAGALLAFIAKNGLAGLLTSAVSWPLLAAALGPIAVYAWYSMRQRQAGFVQGGFGEEGGDLAFMTEDEREAERRGSLSGQASDNVRATRAAVEGLAGPWLMRNVWTTAPVRFMRRVTRGLRDWGQGTWRSHISEPRKILTANATYQDEEITPERKQQEKQAIRGLSGQVRECNEEITRLRADQARVTVEANRLGRFTEGQKRIMDDDPNQENHTDQLARAEGQVKWYDEQIAEYESEVQELQAQIEERNESLQDMAGQEEQHEKAQSAAKQKLVNRLFTWLRGVGEEGLAGVGGGTLGALAMNGIVYTGVWVAGSTIPAWLAPLVIVTAAGGGMFLGWKTGVNAYRNLKK